MWDSCWANAAMVVVETVLKIRERELSNGANEREKRVKVKVEKSRSVEHPGNAKSALSYWMRSQRLAKRKLASPDQTTAGLLSAYRTRTVSAEGSAAFRV